MKCTYVRNYMISCHHKKQRVLIYVQGSQRYSWRCVFSFRLENDL